MAVIFGQKLTRRELEARVGSMKQICDLREATLTGGKEDGTKVIELKNGVLAATIVPGRCLDIANLSYRGIPLNFTGKNGIVYSGFADPINHPLSSVNGGMFYTCGLTNVGASYESDFFHGQMRLIPAEQMSVKAEWEGDEYVLSCGGVMRQNAVCLENLSLKRQITTSLGSLEIKVEDEIRNDGFRDSPWMMMYHVVFGYPLLDESSILLAPVSMEEMSEDARRLHAPSPDGKENGGGAFRALANDKGESTYCLFNPKLSLGLAVTFPADQLPYLSYWKSMQSGDYALGLMPANCHGSGRQKEMDLGTLKTIHAGEVLHTGLTFRIIEGVEAFAQIQKEINLCTKSLA